MFIYLYLYIQNDCSLHRVLLTHKTNSQLYKYNYSMIRNISTDCFPNQLQLFVLYTGNTVCCVESVYTVQINV